MSNSEKEDSDQFLKEKKFNLSGSIDLSKFMEKGEEERVEESTEIIKEELDEAIGEISSPFVSSDSINSDIGRDGSVDKKPDDDLVTQIAKQGEYRMHWALMVTMISVYSIIL